MKRIALDFSRFAAPLLAFALSPSCELFQPVVPNVILISIDTLRADYLSSYGFERETTPNIDAIAREGVLFKNVVSPVPITLPAHSSMLTGTTPTVHGMHDNLSYRLPDANVTLAEMLKDRGFSTGAVISSFVLDSKFNLSQGFDTYNDRFEEEHKILQLNERKGDEATRLALQWLERHQSERFFFFLHYYDPHHDYAPPEPFASEFVDDLYAGEVAFVDHCIGRIMEKLEDLDLVTSTLIVITSDHGEMLGEHGERDHGYFIYQSALRVPLIIKLPGKSTGMREVNQIVGLIDIVPTIAGLLGFDPPTQVQGEDLSPWLEGDPVAGEPRHFYAESLAPSRYYGASSLFGLVTRRWKYIQTTRPELYDLASDPEEAHNLAASDAARADAMKRRLAEILASQEPEGGESQFELDEASLERLEALGYLSRGAPRVELRFDTDGADGPDVPDVEDPKDLIDFYRKDQQLAELIHQENYDDAQLVGEAMLRQWPDYVAAHLQMAEIAFAEDDLALTRDYYARALELDPENEKTHSKLAIVYRMFGDLDAAVAHFRRALEIEPNFAEAKSRLAQSLTAQGHIDEAVDLLREGAASEPNSAKAAAQLGLALAMQGDLVVAVEHYRRALLLDPDSEEAHFYLANALAAQGKLDEAVEHFREVLRLDPERAQAHHRLGLALKEQGETAEAVERFEEALRIDPELAVAHNELGAALKRQGRLEEAARHYREALAIDPDLATAHNNLGSLTGSQGDLDEAIRHFRRALEADPEHAEAHNNLALALRMKGKRDEPLAHFRLALAQRPDWTEPMNELAWILATHPDAKERNPEEAVRLAERCAKISRHRQPVVLDTLAAAYASVGDFAKAVEVAERAVELAAARDQGLANEIQTRLLLYRHEQPFRER